MKTATEQLMIALYEGGYLRGNGNEIDELLEKYKQEEKQQHGNTWDKALDTYEKRGSNYVRAWEDFDEYYAETYASGVLTEGSGAVTSSPIEEKLKSKADALLALRENLYEMHFHKSDRAWLIDAMIDFAGNNYKYFVKSSQTEISDEEIRKQGIKYDNQALSETPIAHFIEGAKWYREQLKKNI